MDRAPSGEALLVGDELRALGVYIFDEYRDLNHTDTWRLPGPGLELVLGHVEDEEAVLETAVLGWRQEDVARLFWFACFQSDRLDRQSLWLHLQLVVFACKKRRRELCTCERGRDTLWSGTHRI